MENHVGGLRLGLRERVDDMRRWRPAKTKQGERGWTSGDHAGHVVAGGESPRGK